VRSNGGIIGGKKTVSTSAASGIWSIRDQQRERGDTNWPTVRLPYNNNLFAHYDASETSGITSSGGLISQLNDLSGNGYHLASTGSYRPSTGVHTQNGKNVITLGADQSLRRYPTQVFSPGFTLLAVYRLPDTTGRYAPVGLGNSLGPTGCCDGYISLDGNTYATAGGGLHGIYTPDSSWDINISLTTNYVVVAWSSTAVQGTSVSATTTYRVNGVAGTLSGRSVGQPNWRQMTNVAGISLGYSGSNLDGGSSNGVRIAEVAIFNTAIPLADIQTLESFLQAKWGI
jgi:hypothetical protein